MGCSKTWNVYSAISAKTSLFNSATLRMTVVVARNRAGARANVAFSYTARISSPKDRRFGYDLVHGRRAAANECPGSTLQQHVALHLSFVIANQE